MDARQFGRFDQKFKVLQRGEGLHLSGTYNIPAGSTGMGPEPTRLLELSLGQFNPIGYVIRQMTTGTEFICSEYQTLVNSRRVRLIPVTHILHLARPIMELDPLTKMMRQADTTQVEQIYCNVLFDDMVYDANKTSRRRAKVITNTTLLVGDKVDSYEVIAITNTAGLTHAVVAYAN